MVSTPGQPGRAFLRTLTRERGAWWRLGVSTLLGVVALLATTILAVVAVILGAWLLGYSDFAFDPADGINPGEMLATNLGLAALAPVSGGLVWALYRVRPRWLSSTRPGLRWSWLLACVGMASVVWSIFLVLGTAGAYVSRSAPIDSTVVVFVVVVLATTPLQAAGEEYLFRGLLLQSLGATRLPAWACCGASGAIFAVAHLQFAPALFADRFVLGVALAWLAIRTGGLEAGIAIHAVKNLAVLVPAGLLDDVEDALDPQGVTWLPLIIDVALLSIVLPWMAASARRRSRDGRLGPPSGWGPPAAGFPPPRWRPPPQGWRPPPGWQPPPPGWQLPPPGTPPRPPGWTPPAGPPRGPPP